jgi:hypothetical protein
VICYGDLAQIILFVRHLALAMFSVGLLVVELSLLAISAILAIPLCSFVSFVVKGFVIFSLEVRACVD